MKLTDDDDKVCLLSQALKGELLDVIQLEVFQQALFELMQVTFEDTILDVILRVYETGSATKKPIYEFIQQLYRILSAQS